MKNLNLKPGLKVYNSVAIAWASATRLSSWTLLSNMEFLMKNPNLKPGLKLHNWVAILCASTTRFSSWTLLSLLQPLNSFISTKDSELRNFVIEPQLTASIANFFIQSSLKLHNWVAIVCASATRFSSWTLLSLLQPMYWRSWLLPAAHAALGDGAPAAVAADFVFYFQSIMKLVSDHYYHRIIIRYLKLGCYTHFLFSRRWHISQLLL